MLRKACRWRTLRYAALRALGGVTQIEQQCRDARGHSFIENAIQDLRYGFRQLLRSPGFSILTILCLTLGIGANAAVFSWAEGILFRPYPAVARRSGCSLWPEQRAESPEGRQLRGRTSSICRETAHCATRFS